MERIYKYPIPIEDNITIELPEGARVLTVQIQKGKPYIWAKVDPNAPKIKRYFKLFGTGHQISNTNKYIGTFQIYEGDLVFHLFEI